MQSTKVYSMSGAYLGELEHAKAGYTLKDVPISTAKIELPLDDEGNELCAPFNWVEVYDGDERVDMFRFIATTKGTIKASGGSVTYKAEHVIATLMDNLMPGYHEIGGTGMSLADCINYILGFQSVQLWQLGRCEFSTYFQYSFNSAYLLNALLALPKQLAEGFLWTTDTTTTPWTLNLVRPTYAVECEILYRHNMVEINKSSDEGTLCTRCYPYGYGEGMNQLTIRDVNNGRLYIDADTIDIWGIKEKPFVDTTMEKPDALKRRAEQWLEECKNPRIIYTGKAIDLSHLTGEPMDTFRPGKLCRMNDQEHGVLVEVRIAQISKDDPAAKPEDIVVTLNSSAASIANEIADLAGRASVNELTAQGATNIAPIYFWNNADKDHPIEIPYDIVAEYVRINKLRLIMHVGSFRSYSLGAAAGGGTLTATYEGGGGARTSSNGGAANITEEQKIVTTEAVTGGPISGHSGDTSGNTGGALDYGGASMPRTDSAGDISTGYAYYAGVIRNDTGSAGGHYHAGPSHVHDIINHNHGMNGHTHSFSDTYTLSWGHYHSMPSGASYTGGVYNYANKEITISGTTGGNSGATTSTALTTNSAGTGATSSVDGHTHPMQHTHPAMAHTHGMAHYHNFSHMHNVVAVVRIPSFTINIQAHAHTVDFSAHSHNLTLENHTHEDIPGIYDGDSVSEVVVEVDGNAVPASAIVYGEADLIPYLSKDTSGKVVRGQHMIRLIPVPTEYNPKGLCSIGALLSVVVFVRSQGGGDY